MATLSSMLSAMSRTIVCIGTQGIEDREKIARIKIVNRLCSVATLSLLVIAPVLSYVLNWRLDIVMPMTLEILINGSVLYLSYKQKHLAASLLLYFLQIVMIAYLGVMLGTLLRLELTIILLIAISFLIFKQTYVRVIAVGGALFDLAFLEVIYYHAPTITQPLSSTTIWTIQFLVVAAITALTVVISRPYITSNDKKYELERTNALKRLFIAQVTHELRTPINSLILIIQKLKEEAMGEEVNRRMEPLLDGGEAMGHLSRSLINNVLKMSEIEAGVKKKVNKEAVNLRECLTGIIKGMQTIADTKGISIRTKLTHLDSRVITDRNILGQITVNLVDNAIKYGSDNSVVQVEAAKMNGGEWQLRVTNEGKKITLDQIESYHRIFERGANPNIEGSGLGLFIVRELTALLDASTEIEVSSLGGASYLSYLVTFPLIEASIIDLVDDYTNAPLFNNFRLQDMHVLIFEDNHLYSIITQSTLEELGCKVSVLFDEETAVQDVEKCNPDVILMDYKLTRCTGAEIIRRLKANALTKNIPVLALTGFAQGDIDDVILEMIEAGAASHLLKPLIASEFQLVINTIFADPYN